MEHKNRAMVEELKVRHDALFGGLNCGLTNRAKHTG